MCSSQRPLKRRKPSLSESSTEDYDLFIYFEDDAPGSPYGSPIIHSLFYDTSKYGTTSPISQQFSQALSKANLPDNTNSSSTTILSKQP